MIPEEHATWLNDYISRVRWQKAKSGPPHAYTVRNWRPDHQHEFEKAVEIIREHGHPENFYKQTYIYLTIGDVKYWTMGSPVPETTIINVAKADNYYGQQTERETWF